MEFRKNQNHPDAPSGARATGQASRRQWRRILACCAAIVAFACAVGPGQSGQNPGMPKGTTISMGLRSERPAMRISTRTAVGRLV